MKTRSPFDLFARAKTKTESRTCDHPGCVERTRDGKPFCLDHVEDHPYVRGLLAQIAEREAQDDLVSRKGPRAVELDGVTVQEILQHLELHGARTKERLVREVNLPAAVLHGYVRALVKRGLVKLGKTKRGSTVVRPVNAAGPTVPHESVDRRVSA